MSDNSDTAFGCLGGVLIIAAVGFGAYFGSAILIFIFGNLGIFLFGAARTFWTYTMMLLTNIDYWVCLLPFNPVFAWGIFGAFIAVPFGFFFSTYMKGKKRSYFRWHIFLSFTFLTLVVCTIYLSNARYTDLDTWYLHKERGRAALGRGEYARAIVEFTASLEKSNNDPETYELRGDAHAKRSELLKAIDNYSIACALDSEKQINTNVARVLLSRANCYQQLNRLNEAVADCDAILRIYPQHNDALTKKTEIEKQLRNLKNNSNNKKKEQNEVNNSNKVDSLWQSNQNVENASPDVQALSGGGPPAVADIHGYGIDYQDGSIGGFITDMPYLQMDDQAGRLKYANAMWRGWYEIKENMLCMKIIDLKTNYPPEHELGIGYSVKLLNAKFENGSDSGKFILHSFKNQPLLSTIERCVPIIPNTPLFNADDSLKNIPSLTIEGYGEDEDDGSIGGFITNYPKLQMDDLQGRLTKVNASWKGEYEFKESELCLRILELTTQSPPMHKIGVGYTITLNNAFFEDGTTKKNFVLYRFRTVPEQSNIEQCFPIKRQK